MMVPAGLPTVAHTFLHRLSSSFAKTRNLTSLTKIRPWSRLFIPNISNNSYRGLYTQRQINVFYGHSFPAVPVSIPSFSRQFSLSFRNLDQSSSNAGGVTEKQIALENATVPLPKQSKGSWADITRVLALARPESRLLAAALVCLVLTSAVSMSLPLIIGKIIDQTREEEVLATSGASHILGLNITQFCALVAAVFVIGAIANFGRTYLLRSVGERLVARLRSRLFLKILSQDSYFFDVGPTKEGMKTGDLLSRLSSDTQIISRTLSGNISDGARALISGFVGMSMMCYVSWKLTLCMSVIIPPLIVLSLFYGRRVKALLRQVQDNLGQMTKVAEEKLQGVKTIQSFSRQQSVLREYNQQVKHIYDTSMTEARLSGIYYSGTSFVGNSMIVGLLLCGTRLISMGELTVGDLSSFMMYAVYTGSSVFGLGNFYTELMKGIGAAERVFELVDLEPRIPLSIGKKVPSVFGDITFDKVAFSYPSRAETSVLEDLSLTIKSGENVCFVGPSGSGKLTIAQILMRFYDPKNGTVTVNGHDIHSLNLNDYRSKLGYVQQEPMLFSGSIRDNILFGLKDASESDIQQALRLAHANVFVDQLRDGIDTIIGPGHTTQLSGGQKQRLLIARTLVRRPKILILDEATSALDSISEEAVMANLLRLHREQGMTIVLIAHRLSTIKNSDRAIVLDKNGHVVEDGATDSLYANSASELNKLLKLSSNNEV